MAIQKKTIAWGDGSGDIFCVSFDPAKLPGTTSVEVTSEPNYTGVQRQKTVTFTTNTPGVPTGSQSSRQLKVIQLTDNLVIATWDTVHTVGLYDNTTKAGFPKS